MRSEIRLMKLVMWTGWLRSIRNSRMMRRISAGRSRRRKHILDWSQRRLVMLVDRQHASSCGTIALS